MHYRCVLYVLKWCVLVGLDWVEPMMFLLLHVTYSYIRSTFFLYLIDIDLCWYFSVCHPLSLSFFRLVALWHPNVSLLHPGTLFVLGLLLLLPLLILPPLMFGSVMRKPVRTSRRTFHDTTFIQNAKSFYRIFLILTFPLSSTVGVRSHFVASRSLVPRWSYKSFTPTYTDLIILYLIFFTYVRGTRIVVTSNLISEMLHVLRVAYLDYPRCGHLRTVSKDKLSSLFCETPSS